MKKQPRNGRLQELAVKDLVPTPDNPRIIDAKAEDFKGLVQSVRSLGVLIPVHVRAHPKRKGKWDLRAGMRRLLAAKAAKRATIPAIVHDGMSDDAAFELTFMENFAREDLSPLEQAKAVGTLLARFKDDVKAVAAKLGQSARWVRLRAKLQNLSPAWREAIADKQSFASEWGAGHLELVARFEQEVQSTILAALEDSGDVDISVPELGQWLNDHYLHQLAGAPWKSDDAKLEPTAGSCGTCPKRSSLQGLLFHQDEDPDTVKRDDRCLDDACWRRKMAAYLDHRRDELKSKYPNLVYIEKDRAYREARERLQKRFPDVLNTWDWEGAKKSTPGAKPALVVHGPGTGELRWIRVYASSTGSSARGEERPLGPDGKPLPTPLKERRAKLEGRRTALVITKLLKAIADAKLAYNNRQLIALAAAFGTDKQLDAWSDEKAWHDRERFSSSPAEAMLELWRTIKGVLQLRLRYWMSPSKIPVGLILETKRIAKLIGVDIEKLTAEAAKDLPDPKSWALLKADGTKKRKA